jgi:hypothetical protein
MKFYQNFDFVESKKTAYVETLPNTEVFQSKDVTSEKPMNEQICVIID